MFTARYVLHSMFCPHSVFMCFVWILEQTAVISLYSINWLVLDLFAVIIFAMSISPFALNNSILAGPIVTKFDR